MLRHEVGHFLGQEHEANHLMAETLTAATRQVPASNAHWADLTAALDSADVLTDTAAWLDSAHRRNRKK